MRTTIKQLGQHASRLPQLANEFRHYILAAALPLIVCTATQMAPTWSAPVTFSLYVAAIFVGAYVGGWRAGLGATALAVTLVLWHYGFANRGSNLLDITELYPVLVPFAFVCVLVTHLANTSQRSVTLFSNVHETILNMAEAVILTDQRGQIAFMNKTAETLTGWADGLKKPVEGVFRLLDESTREPLPSPAAQVMQAAGPAVRDAIAVLVAKDNKERPVEYSAEPLKDPNGVATGVLFQFRDVSQRRAADQELRQREAQFRALAVAAPVGIMVLDQNGACTFSNAACQKVAGIAAKDAQGTGWANFIQPEDQRIVEEWRTAAQQGLSFVKECRFQDIMNQIHWVRVRADAARSDRGQYLGHVAVLEDLWSQKELERALNEQKQAEEKLKASFQEREKQANQRIAALDAARVQMEKQLADHQDAAATVQRDSGQKQTEWQQTETKLRQDMSAVAESHRRELERVIAERKQLEDALQQARQQKNGTADPRVGSLDAVQQQLQNQLAERQKELETLKDEYALFQTEWEEAESKLRQDLAALTQTTERQQKQLSDLQQREKNLRSELERTRAERDQVAEQHRRDAEEWDRRHSELRDARDSQHSQLEVQRSQWEQRHENLSSNLNRLSAEHEAIRTRHTQLEEERSHWQQRHETLAADFAKLTEQHEAMQTAHADVSASRRLLHSVLSHLAEGVCAIDKSGGILFFNAAAETLLGWPAAEVRGQKIEFLAPDVDWSSIPTDSVLRKELALRQQNGEPLAVDCSIATLGSGGETEGLVLAFHSHQQVPECSTNTAPDVVPSTIPNSPMERLLHRLADCSSTILTELKQAFAALTASNHSAAEPWGPASAMERAMRHLTRHLQRLEAASRIAENELPLSREAVDVGRVIHHALEAAKPELEARNHHLTVALPLAPERVWADETALQQALGILLENATAYTPAGGQIAVAVERWADEIWLRVKDNGRGLAPQAIPELLTLSAKSKRFWTEDSNGLGIGLALARSLAELHGGTLTAISAGPGLGSEFILRWPAWQQGMRIDEGSPTFTPSRTHLWRAPALLSLTGGTK